MSNSVHTKINDKKEHNHVPIHISPCSAFHNITPYGTIAESGYNLNHSNFPPDDINSSWIHLFSTTQSPQKCAMETTTISSSISDQIKSPISNDAMTASLL